MRFLGALICVATLIPGTAYAIFDNEEAWNNLLQFAVRQVNAPGEFEIRLSDVKRPGQGKTYIETLTIEDSDGVWLEARGLDILWSPSALVGGNFRFRNLEARSIELKRMPIGRGERPADKSPLRFEWPRSPVPLEIQKLLVEKLILPKVPLPERLEARIEGALTDKGATQDAALKIVRIDERSGAFELTSKVNVETGAIEFTLDAKEEGGGLVSQLTGIPPSEDIDLKIASKGNRKRLPVSITGGIGKIGAARAEGIFGWEETFIARLEAVITPYERTAPEWRAAIGDEATISLDAEEIERGNYRLRAFDINSNVFKTTGVGQFAPGEDKVNLDLRFGVVDRERLNALIAPAHVGGLAGYARITGALSSPEIDVDASAVDIKSAWGSTDTLELRAVGDPARKPGALMQFKATAKAQGLELADPGLAAAFGDAPNLTALGSYEPLGQVIFLESLDIDARSVKARGNARYSLETKSISAEFAGDAKDISPFAALAGLDVQGKAEFDFSLEELTPQSLKSARLEASLHELTSADAAIAAALGEKAELVLDMADTGDGTTRIRKGHLRSQVIAGNLSGAFSLGNGDLDINANLKTLDNKAITGLFEDQVTFEGADIRARLSGSVAAPVLDMGGRAAGVSFAGGEIPLVAFDIRTETSNQRRAPFTAELRLSDPEFEAGYEQMIGDAPVIRAEGVYDRATGKISLDQGQIALAAGRALAEGFVDLRKRFIDLDLSTSIPELSLLAPLTGQLIRGSVTASGSINGPTDTPSFETKIIGAGIAAGDARIDTLLGDGALEAKGQFDNKTGVIRLDRAIAELAPGQVSLSGKIFTRQQRLDLDYKAAAEALQNFSPLTGLNLSGSADLSGELTGSSHAPRLTAHLSAENPQLNAYGVQALNGYAELDLSQIDAPFQIAVKAAAPDAGNAQLNAILGEAFDMSAEGSYNRATGRISLRTAEFEGRAVDLKAAGKIDLSARQVALDYALAAKDLGEFSALAGQKIGGAIDAAGQLKGSFNLPQMTIAATGSVLEFDVLGAATAHFSGTVTPKDKQFRFTGRADLTSPYLQNPALEALLGAAPSAEVSGVYANGTVHFDSLKAELASGRLEAEGNVDVKARTMDLSARLSGRDLQALSALTGQPLKGRLEQLNLSLEGSFETPKAHLSGKAQDIRAGAYGLQTLDIDAVLVGDGHGFSISGQLDGQNPYLVDPALANLVGLGPGLDFAGYFDPSRQRLSLAKADLAVQAAHLSLSGNVDLAAGQLDLSYNANAHDLALFSEIAGRPLSGMANLTGFLNGPLANPSTAGRLEAEEVGLDGVWINPLKAEYTLASLLQAPSGTVTLSGYSDLGSISAQTQFAIQADGFVLEELTFDLPGAGSTVALRQTLAGNFTGQIAFGGQVLNAVKRLTGLDVSGALNGHVILSEMDGGQHIALSAEGTALRFSPSAGGAQLTADYVRTSAILPDPRSPDPFLEALIDASGLHVGPASLSLARLSLQGRRSAFNYDLEAEGDFLGVPRLKGAEPDRIKAAGVFTEEAPLQLSISTASGNVQDAPFVLNAPLAIAQKAGGWNVSGLDLGLDGGRLSGEGLWSSRGAVAELSVEELPARLTRIAGVEIVKQGLVNAQLSLDVPNQNGNVSGTVVDLLPMGVDFYYPLALALDGEWEGQTLNLAATGTSGAFSVPITAKATLPIRRIEGAPLPALIGSAAMNGALEWHGDMAALWQLLPYPEHDLSGTAHLQATIGGTPDAPQYQGGVRFKHARYENFALGTVAQNIAGDARFDGSERLSVSLEAEDGAGGALQITGYRHMSNGQTEISATLDNFLVARRDDVTSVLTGTGKLVGQENALVLSADLRNVYTEYRLVGGGAPSMVIIDTIPVGDSAPQHTHKPKTDGSGLLELDVTLDIPQGAFARGRGLESEWDGLIRITGSSSEPQITGAISNRSGWFNLIGKQFHIEHGNVHFDGDVSPQLDVRFSRKNNSVKGWIDIKGEAISPIISFGSLPALPEDEVLPKLLFGQSSSTLSAFEAAQMADGIAMLTSGQPGVANRIGNAIGVDTLQVSTDEGGATTITTGKYVTDGVFVGARQNTGTGETTALVEIETINNIELDAELGQTESKVGVRWQLNY